MPRYVVSIIECSHAEARVVVEAATPEEAESVAERMAEDEEIDFPPPDIGWTTTVLGEADK